MRVIANARSPKTAEGVEFLSKEDVLKFDNTGEILRTFVTKNYEGYFKSNSLVLIYCKNIEIKSIKKIKGNTNECI